MLREWIGLMCYFALSFTLMAVCVAVAWLAMGPPYMSGQGTLNVPSLWLIAMPFAGAISAFVAAKLSLATLPAESVGSLMPTLMLASEGLQFLFAPIKKYNSTLSPLPDSILPDELTLNDAWPYLDIPLWACVFFRGAVFVGLLLAIQLYRRQHGRIAT